MHGYKLQNLNFKTIIRIKRRTSTRTNGGAAGPPSIWPLVKFAPYCLKGIDVVGNNCIGGFVTFLRNEVSRPRLTGFSVSSSSSSSPSSRDDKKAVVFILDTPGSTWRTASTPWTGGFWKPTETKHNHSLRQSHNQHPPWKQNSPLDNRLLLYWEDSILIWQETRVPRENPPIKLRSTGTRPTFNHRGGRHSRQTEFSRRTPPI